MTQLIVVSPGDFLVYKDFADRVIDKRVPSTSSGRGCSLLHYFRYQFGYVANPHGFAIFAIGVDHHRGAKRAANG